jgi:pimeloyl-ACP methyl ester carboxylesterase
MRTIRNVRRQRRTPGNISFDEKWHSIYDISTIGEFTMSTSESIQYRERIERTIDVRGIPTHLFEGGDPIAPPLLYLHGMLNGNLWLDYHQKLAQHFHLFAPDIPGFGLTERPGWMRDISDYVLYLHDLLNALSLEAPFIIGHSLGGWMAAEIAVWYPERVSKLVLSNALGLRVKGTPLPDIFAMAPEVFIGTCFENMMAAFPLLPAEITVDVMFAQYKQFTTLASLLWNPSYDPHLERRLERINCPTLLVWGENDRLMAPVYGDTYHRQIPGSRLVKLSGTGHMPMFEQMEAWSAAISQFLNQEAVLV